MNTRRLVPVVSVVLILFTGALLALNGGLSGSFFSIRAIPLEWETRLGPGRMEQEIARQIEAGVGRNFQAIMGKPPWDVNLDQLGRSIAQLPWVERARVARAFPDRLIVSIRPKQPMAVLVDSQEGVGQRSRFRPLAGDGQLMPEWDSDVIPDVPFLRGAKFEAETASGVELRREVIGIISSLPERGILARSNIVEIGFSEAQGFSLLLLSPRTEVCFGRENLDIKIHRVEHVLNYLSTHGKRAPLIDSTSVKKVVVRAQHRP